MSSLAILFLCGCLAILAAGKAAPPVYAPEDAELHFQRFIEEYAKNYSDESEYQARFQIFKDNLELANRMNEQSDHATFGITQFMDLTSEEFINSYTGLRIPQVNLTGCNRVTESEIAYVNAPASHDWRQYGAVTRVKNQKSCGGCYAFSATGNIEGQYAIKHQQLAELSEQQIIDCDRGSNGCYGGYMSAAFQTIIQQGGIESESTYPYREYQGTCHFTPGKAVVRLTGCNVYNIVSESTMAQLLYTTGPISIGVRASAFQAYNGGIMSDAFCSGGNVNHAVLLVGYGQEQGISYWIVKNSWGTSWGEQGYFRMLRSPRSDSCGMLANTGLTASSIIL